MNSILINQKLIGAQASKEAEWGLTKFNYLNTGEGIGKAYIKYFTLF